MPFIDSKVTLPMTEDKKETIKAKLGQAITTLNKSEGFLMVGFDDDYTLYMGGKKLEKGAFVAYIGKNSKECLEKEFHFN